MGVPDPREEALERVLTVGLDTGVQPHPTAETVEQNQDVRVEAVLECACREAAVTLLVEAHLGGYVEEVVADDLVRRRRRDRGAEDVPDLPVVLNAAAVEATPHVGPDPVAHTAPVEEPFELLKRGRHALVRS